MKPYKEWTKEEVITHWAKTCPEMKPYLNNVRWENTDEGWAPSFPDAPNDVLIRCMHLQQEQNQ